MRRKKFDEVFRAYGESLGIRGYNVRGGISLFWEQTQLPRYQLSSFTVF